MSFQFATCDRTTAFKFLQKFFPTAIITEAMAKDVLDLVEADVIRIPDPHYHPNGAINRSHNWDESRHAEVSKILNDFYDAASASYCKGVKHD